MLFITYIWKFVSSETKDVNIKVFNKIRKINEAKTMVKHVSGDC